jgi:hypothetical protein
MQLVSFVNTMTVLSLGSSRFNDPFSSASQTSADISLIVAFGKAFPIEAPIQLLCKSIGM